MCACVCERACVFVCLWVRVCVCVCVLGHVCMSEWTGVCERACVCVCVCDHFCECECKVVCVLCICVHICVHICTGMSVSGQLASVCGLCSVRWAVGFCVCIPVAKRVALRGSCTNTLAHVLYGIILS